MPSAKGCLHRATWKKVFLSRIPNIPKYFCPEFWNVPCLVRSAYITCSSRINFYKEETDSQPLRGPLLKLKVEQFPSKNMFCGYVGEDGGYWNENTGKYQGKKKQILRKQPQHSDVCSLQDVLNEDPELLQNIMYNIAHLKDRKPLELFFLQMNKSQSWLLRLLLFNLILEMLQQF